jgi:hypothetical protein
MRVIDGMHRLMAASSQGSDTIDASASDPHMSDRASAR